MSIYVPTIQTPYLAQGLIDSTDPRVATDNKALSALRAAGVVIMEPAGLERLNTGGKRISVPSINDPADLEQVDLSSADDMDAQSWDASTDVAVVRHKKQLYSFKRSDKIQAGADPDADFSRKLGGKVAKAISGDLLKCAVAAIDAVDTPTANCHTLNVYSGTTPVYPTVDLLRQAKALLGDAATGLTTAVMHSTSFALLVKDILSTYGLTTLGTESLRSGLVAQILGISNWVITDQMPITGVGSDNYNILLLGQGAMWAGYQQQPTIDRDRDIKKTSSVEYLAVEAAIVAHLRYVKWASATENPDDTAFQLATNWDEAYDDHRRVLAAKLVCN